jgi:chloramphenicol 3-O phosphotransferase
MKIKPEFGKIIMLIGASSAGKSTLCKALQEELNEPFLQFSLDFFMFNSNVLPKKREHKDLFHGRPCGLNCLTDILTALPALHQLGITF